MHLFMVSGTAAALIGQYACGEVAQEEACQGTNQSEPLPSSEGAILQYIAMQLKWEVAIPETEPPPSHDCLQGFLPSFCSIRSNLCSIHFIWAQLV